jgi:isocitrate dehydrogenase
MSKTIPITAAYGDGIGPEIMDAVMYILKESKAPLAIETIEIGEKLYKKNYSSGISDDTWKSLERTKVLLKAPITTPQGGGYKSLNVTLRKALGLFANVRPSISYHPFVSTLHPKMDLVVVRENEEDIYAGIEYRQTHNVYESLKLISRTGSEKIIRYAFEYAVKNNRKKVSCFSKDNIMKFSDGIFHKVFDEIAKEYPAIEHDHHIMDIATARVANRPENFDVIVTQNLYGDIISDVTAEISGSVGLAGSSNIGEEYAMFEAIHGSAPDISGKDIANPSGLINAAVMMLVHVGLPKYATTIENAWKKTIEDGIHTTDIYSSKNSAKKVGTKEFAKEVVARFGQKPSSLILADYAEKAPESSVPRSFEISKKETKKLVGVDVFIDYLTSSPAEIADKINGLDLGNSKLTTISSKGLLLWPRDQKTHFYSDHWALRFMPKSGSFSHDELTGILSKLASNRIDFIKTENLYDFDDKKGYSLAQGE